MIGELYPGEFEAMEHNGRMDALEQESFEDWCDVPSDEMTLEQARQAVKDLRKKLVEYLEQEPCPDAISRQAALDALMEILDRPNHAEFLYTDEICKALKALPSAQQERKKGKWIYHPEIGWGDTWLCDQCGEKTTSTVMGKPRANYCPMCGADMRGEQNG